MVITHNLKYVVIRYSGIIEMFVVCFITCVSIFSSMITRRTFIRGKRILQTWMSSRYVPFPFFEELFSWNDVVVTAGVVVVKERVEDPSDVEDEMGDVDAMLSVQI